MTTQDPHDVVRLVTANNPLQAQIWMQALQDEGIPCKVVGDMLEAGIANIPGVQPELWVHRDDVPRAEEVLRHGEALGEDEETGIEPVGESV